MRFSDDWLHESKFRDSVLQGCCREASSRWQTCKNINFSCLLLMLCRGSESSTVIDITLLRTSDMQFSLEFHEFLLVERGISMVHHLNWQWVLSSYGSRVVKVDREDCREEPVINSLIDSLSISGSKYHISYSNDMYTAVIVLDVLWLFSCSILMCICAPWLLCMHVMVMHVPFVPLGSDLYYMYSSAVVVLVCSFLTILNCQSIN